MANQRIIYQTTKYIPITTGACEEVYICLCDDYKAYTADGSGLVKATVQNTGRPLGPGPHKPMFERSRPSELYQYSLVYDDSQMALDLGGLPIVINCDWICEINPYTCTTDALLEGSTSFDMLCLTHIDSLPEWDDSYEGCLVYVTGSGLYYGSASNWVQLGSS